MTTSRVPGVTGGEIIGRTRLQPGCRSRLSEWPDGGAGLDDGAGNCPQKISLEGIWGILRTQERG